MSITLREVESQPQVWRRPTEMLAEVSAQLPATGALIIEGEIDPRSALVTAGGRRRQLVHRVAVALAERRGEDPDRPHRLPRRPATYGRGRLCAPSLARSVVLP